MNLKKLLNLGFLLVILTAFSFNDSYAQVKYLNSTDGDDSYSGENATNSPLGSGPKRTLEGAFEDFATGTTVHMSAGNYNFGTDAGGYTLPAVAANKSMTFVVQTYNANDVVSLNGGPLLLQNGTGTLKFEAQDAGVQSITFSGANIVLASGTLDVSGITFNVTAATTNLTRTDGAVVGSPVFAGKGMIILYNGTKTQTAAGELPGTVNTLTLSHAAGKAITFPNDLTFNTNGGGLSNTTVADATFNGLVHLKANNGNDTPTLVNNQPLGADWNFAGGVTLTTTQTNVGNPIVNSNTGSLTISGPLTFQQSNSAGTVDGVHVSTVTQTAAGKLNITGGVSQVESPKKTGVYVAKRTPVANLNVGAGTAQLGGGLATTINGTYVTAGATTTTLTGPVTVNGTITNAGETKTGGNTLTVTDAGPHVSAGNVSGTGTLLVNNTAVTAWGGAGSVPNIEVANKTTLTVATTLITGNVTSNSDNLLTLAGATTVSGGISLNDKGGILLGAAGTVTGAVSITGSGTLTTNVTQFSSTTTMSAGKFLLGGNVTLMGSYNQSGGELDFATFILDNKADFVRTSGTVTPGTGTLQFSAGGSQTFTGGTNMRVYNFAVNGVGTGVNFVMGSLEVMNNSTIVSNTNVQLSTLNIRMLGAAPNAPGSNTFTNAGQYTSSGGGGIIFEGPVGTIQYLAGNGVNSNIDIRLQNPASTVNIAAGETVTWSGNLTLTRGTINVVAGTVLNPSTTLTTPTLRRNLSDPNANALPDGRQLISGGANGVFNATNQPYALEYFGTAMNQDEAVGTEFVTGANAMVTDLTISAKPFKVLLPTANNYPFSGNVSVVNSSELQLVGTATLVSSATGAAHAINGAVTLAAGATGTFEVAGAGTITGGSVTKAPADASSIADLTVNSTGVYNVNSLKVIGDLTVAKGTANVGMLLYGTPADQGDITNLAVTGGSAVLTADVDVLASVGVTGTANLDFANQNLYMLGGAFNVTSNTATLTATGADTKGYLVFEVNAGLGTGTVLVPRIKINNGITATLTANSGFSDIFTDYSAAAGNGTLAMVANGFNSAGGTWNAKGTYTGTGTVTVTGATNLNLIADISIPALTLNNDTKVLTLVDSDGVANASDLTVRGLFKSTKGAIEFNKSDVILTGAGAAFAYTAGTFTATSADGLGKNNSNGELVFNNGGAQTFAVGTTKFEVPNIRFQGAGGVTLSTTNPFKVTERLVFGNSAVAFGKDNRMELADGVWIEKIGNNHLDKVPMFGATHNIAYTTLASTIEDEMPAAGTILNDLYFAAGATVTGSKALKVNGTLYLVSGDYNPTAAKMWTLEMGDGTTVNRSNGIITDPAGGAGVFAISGGPITLTYSNTIAINTTGQEYPTAVTVTTLNVNGDNAGDHLTLHADRSAGDLVLETGLGPKPDINTVQFDLNAKTLTITNAATATLTRGTLISNGAVATLNVTGLIEATSNVTITNVNVNAATANLACAFGGGGTAVITGDATFAGFNGNATVGGNITLNAAFAGNLTANGTDTQNLVTTGNQAITTLTLNMTGTTPVLSVSGGNITTGAIANGLVFQNGILNMTTGTVLILPQPSSLPVNTFGLGYNRTAVENDPTKVGHVVGNIQRFAGVGDGAINGGAATEGRFIFPTGNITGEFRPATITFSPDNPVISSANIFVGHVDADPEGVVGLPTPDGQVGDYTDFYWLMASNPQLSSNQKYNIELEAHNIGLPFENEEVLRIIRRQDGNADKNEWIMQSDAFSYDNGITVVGADTLVEVRASLAEGGIVRSGNRFTIGAPALGPQFIAPTVTDYTMMADETLDVQFTAEAKAIGVTITGYTVAGPDFATIDAATGKVTLAPKVADISATAYVVTVTATASDGATVDKAINVTVSAVPVPLAFTAVIGNTSTKSGNDYMFQYAANGGDGITYKYALDLQAGDATTGTIAVDTTGKLTWSPLAADNGKQAIITVSVVSGVETVTTVDTIKVIGNSPPSFLLAGASVLPDTLIWVGETLEWTYIAIDPDNDALTYSFVGQFPSDAILNPTTGEFSWAPKTALQFPVLITVQAHDGMDSTNTQAIVTINEKTVTVSGTVSYNVSALAIVGATVNLMDGATLVGTATTDDNGAYSIADVSAGSYDVVVTKTDNWGGSLSSDALETQLSVIGDTTALSTDLQKLAANVVDVAGGIETDDALAILNASVGLKAFDVNDWMFEATTITVGTQNVSQDVSGICAGDARSDYNPMGLAKTANIAVNSDEVLNIKKESEFELPISIAELAEVGSFTFKLRYNVEKVEFLGVSSVNGGMLVSNVVDDVISIAWVNLGSKDVKVKDGSALVSLKFRATEMFSKSDEVSLELLDGAELTDKLAKNLSAGINIPVVAIGIPDVFALRQNYPNPFNPSTTIQYDLPENGKVTLTVYNSLGQRVGTLVNTKQVAGAYEVNFNASNLASGVYLYRVTVEGSKNFVMTKKMILMK